MMSVQKIEHIYAGEIPNGKNPDSELYQRNIPKLHVFLEDQQQKTAVLILPGGGYSHLAMQHEGMDVAKAFNEHGISAFVLQYRLPSPNIMQDKSVGPLQDAQQALCFIRENYPQFEQVGILGFSAGGHLAAMVMTKFQQPAIDNPNFISLNPDFSILIYPLISMEDTITHKGSKLNLLGSDASADMVENYSAHRQISLQNSPVFLVHAADDKSVPVQNSYCLLEALKAKHIPVEYMEYPTGGHGFGLINKTSDIRWFPKMIRWLQKVISTT